MLLEAIREDLFVAVEALLLIQDPRMGAGPIVCTLGAVKGPRRADI
jgi:hypothetical protein